MTCQLLIPSRSAAEQCMFDEMWLALWSEMMVYSVAFGADETSCSWGAFHLGSELNAGAMWCDEQIERRDTVRPKCHHYAKSY